MTSLGLHLLKSLALLPPVAVCPQAGEKAAGALDVHASHLAPTMDLKKLLWLGLCRKETGLVLHGSFAIA